MEDKKSTPDVKFVIDGEKVLNVAVALGKGDVSECLAPDVKHVYELLAHVVVLEEIAPGFLDETLATWIPHFLKQRERAAVEAMALKKAGAAGFSEEWREAIATGRHPRQKDLLWKQVQLYMKANNASQADAIGAIAAHTGRDEDDVRRTVTRSKSRRS
jgi:hypothetical protein